MKYLLLFLSVLAYSATTPYMGIEKPSLIADDPDYVEKLDDAWDAIDAHDHSTGKGTGIYVGNSVITGTNIYDGAVTTAKMTLKSVTTQVIADKAVTLSKMGSLTVVEDAIVGGYDRIFINSITDTLVEVSTSVAISALGLTAARGYVVGIGGDDCELIAGAAGTCELEMLVNATDITGATASFRQRYTSAGGNSLPCSARQFIAGPTSSVILAILYLRGVTAGAACQIQGGKFYGYEL